MPETTVNNYRSHNIAIVKLVHQLIVEKKKLYAAESSDIAFPRSLIFPRNLKWNIKNTMYLSLKHEIQISINNAYA